MAMQFKVWVKVLLALNMCTTIVPQDAFVLLIMSNLNTLSYARHRCIELAALCCSRVHRLRYNYILNYKAAVTHGSQPEPSSYLGCRVACM